jgi:hypothetical protein
MNMKRKTVYSVVNWEKYIDPTHPIIKPYVDRFGSEIYSTVIEKIKKAYSNGEEYCDIIDFRKTKIDSVNIKNIVAVAHKSDFVTILNRMMNWYIRKEAYEVCSELKELITTIESGRRLVIKKKRKVSLSVR